MSRRHNPERAKLHLNYTIPEIAALFDINKTTVSHWISAGLTPTDRKRPLIFTGAHLRAFVKARMAATLRPLRVGEIFCVACKRGQMPTGGAAVFKMVSATSCNMIGQCPDCRRRIFRRVAMATFMGAIARATIAAGSSEQMPLAMPNTNTAEIRWRRRRAVSIAPRDSICRNAESTKGAEIFVISCAPSIGNTSFSSS